MSQPTDDDRESRLNEALAEYLRAVDAGRPPPPDEFLGRYPDLADDLRSFLQNRDAVERLAEPLRGAGLDETLVSAALPAGETQRIRYFGDYELLEEIGRGGMGVVYKARQKTLNRLVALKMLLSGQLASAEDVQRFQQEAESAANLDHPHIAPIYEIGTHHGQNYFSMKLIEGGTLREVLRAPERDTRGVVRLLALTARAVHHAHQRGVLHRDLKPGNILLDPEGTPYVTDFGLAKRVEGDSDMTRTGAVVGTPSYMAPEQAGGEKQLSTAVDVFSLGAILYELLAGRPPFRGATPMETLMAVLNLEPERPRLRDFSVDRDLETIALKCLEKDPARRYDSAAALADDLDRWLRGEPIVARPASTRERLVKWAKREPAAAVFVAFSLVFVLSLLGTLAYSNSQINRALDAELIAKNAALRSATQAALREADAVAARKDADARRQEAEESRRDADARRKEAESARRDEQRQSARLALERGLTLFEQGQMNHGLLWMGKSMTLAPPDDTEFQRVAWLNIASWAPSMHTARWRQHRPAVTTIFARDPRHIIQNNNDDSVRCVDTQTDQVVWETPNAGGGPALALSLDGARVASGGGGTIFVLHAESGRIAQGPIDVGGDVQTLAFHPDGTEVLIGEVVAAVEGAAGRTGRARRWSLTEGKTVGTPWDQPHPVTSVAYSPDGAQCVTGCQPARVRHEGSGEFVQRWDRATGEALGPAVDHPAGLRGLRFLPDGRTPHWVPRPQRRMLDGAGTTGRNVDVSPDGRYMLTRGFDYRSKVWDLYTGQLVGQPIYQSGWTFSDSALFRPDGLATLLGFGSELQLWDFAGLRRPQQTSLHGPKQIAWSAFSPSRRRVAAVIGQDVLVFDVETGGVVGAPMHHAGRARSEIPLAFGGADRLLMVANRDNTAEVWDAATGQPLWPAFPHGTEVTSVALSADGRVALSASMDGKAKAWDLTTGRQMGPDYLLSDHPEGLSLSADGSLAVGGMWRGFEARVWEPATGTRLRSLGTGGVVQFTSQSPDGQWIAASSWGDQRVHLTRRTGETYASHSVEHPHGAIRTSFSPDSRLLVSVCQATARVIDVATGLRIGPVLTFARPVSHASFDPAGARLIVLTEDAVLHTFPAPRMGDEVGEEFARRALVWTQLLTGMSLDDNGQAFPLTGQDLQTLRTGFLRLGPDLTDLTPSSDQIRRWHRMDAHDHLAARRWFPAHWHLTKLLEDDPADVAARGDLVAALLGMDLPDLADREAERLPNRGQDNQRLAELRGSLAVRKKAWAEAARHFARAAELDPRDVSAVRCQIACLVLAGDPAPLAAALSKIPDPVGRLTFEAELRLYLGISLAPDFEAGREHRLARAVMSWSDLMPHHAVGLTAYRAGRLDKARQATEQSLGFAQSYPVHVNNWLLMAAIEFRAGRPEEARRWSAKADAWITRTTAEQPPDAWPPGGLELADWLECLVLQAEVTRLDE